MKWIAKNGRWVASGWMLHRYNWLFYVISLVFRDYFLWFHFVSRRGIKLNIDGYSVTHISLVANITQQPIKRLFNLVYVEENADYVERRREEEYRWRMSKKFSAYYPFLIMPTVVGKVTMFESLSFSTLCCDIIDFNQFLWHKFVMEIVGIFSPILKRWEKNS